MSAESQRFGARAAPALELNRPTLVRLARGALLALVLQASGAGLGYGVQVALAHWMGTGEYGAYAYATTWATVLSLFAGLGLQAAVIRLIPLYRSGSNPSRIAGVVSGGRRLTLIASIALAAVGTGVAAAVGGSHLVAGLAPTLLGLWLIPSLALVDFDISIARTAGRVGIAYTPWFVVRPVLILAVVGVIYYLDGTASATVALIATLGIFVVLTLAQRLLADRTLRPDVRGATPAEDVRGWMGVALPLLLVGGFQLALVQTDVLVVGALGGRHDAALYTAASKTALLVSYFLLALNVVAAPLVPTLTAAGDRTGLQRLASVGAKWVFWPSLVLVVLLISLSEEVLRLFGSDFAAAQWPLIVLLIAQIANAAYAANGYLITYSGNHKSAATVYGVSGIANLFLCIAGMAFFGMVGAAVATAVTMVLWNVWLDRVGINKMDVHSSFLFAIRRPDEDRAYR